MPLPKLIHLGTCRPTGKSFGLLYNHRMCGRFTLDISPDDLTSYFKLPVQRVLRLEPRYNIAPSQGVTVVRVSNGERRLDVVRWGLIPHWAEDMKVGYKMINCRAETSSTLPAFREAFRHRRCVVPASGFYEWPRTGGRKRPSYYYREDGQLMALAGLWECWRDPKREDFIIESCTILTTEANNLIKPTHNRMPVILQQKEIDAWLDPEQDPEKLKRLLGPIGSDVLACHPVSDFVNNPRHEGHECIEPPQSETDPLHPS